MLYHPTEFEEGQKLRLLLPSTEGFTRTVLHNTLESLVGKDVEPSTEGDGSYTGSVSLLGAFSPASTNPKSIFGVDFSGTVSVNLGSGGSMESSRPDQVIGRLYSRNDEPHSLAGGSQKDSPLLLDYDEERDAFTVDHDFGTIGFLPSESYGPNSSVPLSGKVTGLLAVRASDVSCWLQSQESPPQPSAEGVITYCLTHEDQRSHDDPEAVKSLLRALSIDITDHSSV